jgi:hypothetical protein
MITEMSPSARICLFADYAIVCDSFAGVNDRFVKSEMLKYSIGEYQNWIGQTQVIGGRRRGRNAAWAETPAFARELGPVRGCRVGNACRAGCRSRAGTAESPSGCDRRAAGSRRGAGHGLSRMPRCGRADGVRGRHRWECGGGVGQGRAGGRHYPAETEMTGGGRGLAPPAGAGIRRRAVRRRRSGSRSAG